MIESIESGRKEDGNRSIADKIINRLHDLDKTVDSNLGRWAWELLQNAKDSIADELNRKVAVKLEFKKDYIEFKHNGTHFTETDIRGLINQISSKEVQEGEQPKKTGRFGTGFLTTHLLSKIIDVKGIVETKKGEFYSFQFPLDREGKTKNQLVPKIENAWEQFHKSTKKLSDTYTKQDFNTSFGYVLNTSEQWDIAKQGIDEFVRLLPLVLTFNPKIESVEIASSDSSRRIKFVNSVILNDGFITPIQKITDGKTDTIFIATVGSEKVKIAVQLLKTDMGYSIVNNEKVPKLFCDFPLIGTEDFHLPFIINSFYFHPQTERNGLWLKGKKDGSDIEANENQELLSEAKDLFARLLSKITTEKFRDLYNICETATPEVHEDYFDEVWFKESIQRPIRDLLWETPLVEIENSKDKKSLKEIWFPMKSYPADVQGELWKFFYDLFPTYVCKNEHLVEWSKVYWEGCQKISYKYLVENIEKCGSMTALGKKLNMDYKATIQWLNKVCAFIYNDETNLSLFEKHCITPNQNGVLLKKGDLYIDEIGNPDLIEILMLLGEDWRDILLDKNVSFGEYKVKEKKNISEKITEKLRNPKDADETKRAIALLCEWFEVNNPDVSKNLFSELYKNRAELFMNTIPDKESLYKVMRSGTDLSELSRIAQTLADNPNLADDIQGAAQLTGLFEEFNVTTIEELKAILRNNQNSRESFIQTEFTAEILASLGVTNEDELEAALKDKDLAALFSHTSKPNVAMFKYAQSLIDRAKKNIKTHLSTLPDYNCREIEQLAPSVFGGIKKDGLSIHVVVRPSDFGEVIVYYSSEKDTLDYTNAELWIENGKDKPKLLTLGKILKNTGINKIPV